MRGWKVAAVLLGVGCGPVSIDGEVDGQSVGGARDAIWDEFEVDLGPLGSYQYTAVILTDVHDACEVTDAFAEALREESDCESLCEVYLDTVEQWELSTEGYWTLSLFANTSDDEAGEFAFDPLAEAGEFDATFSRIDSSDLVGQSECEDACEDRELLESSEDDGEDGTLELEAAEGEELSGTFTVEFGGADLLEGDFTATRCDMTDWFGF